MNDDKQIVPIVEEDQGEGWKDPLDNHDISEMTRADKKRLHVFIAPALIGLVQASKNHYDQLARKHACGWPTRKGG